MPSHSPTIKLHCDLEYPFHTNCEINFWIPFTRVWGSNTLHSESSPGCGDFHPFELEPGQGVRFCGNTCRHFTQANQTGSTRVSFDMRVIPRSLYHHDYGGFIGDYPAAELALPGPPPSLCSGLCNGDVNIEITCVIDLSRVSPASEDIIDPKCDDTCIQTYDSTHDQQNSVDYIGR